MASSRLSPVLALALELRTAVTGSRSLGFYSADERRQPALGRAANPRRTAQARHRDQPSDSCQVHGAKTREAFADLAQLAPQSGCRHRCDRHVRRGVRLVSAAVVMIILAHDRRKIVRFDVTRYPTPGWL